MARWVHSGGWRRSYHHVLRLRDGRSVKLPPWLENHAPLRAFLAGIPLER